MTLGILIICVLLLIALLAVSVILTARFMFKTVVQFKLILFQLAKERKR